MNSRYLEPNPLWRGTPPICIVANLAAFSTEAEALAFNDAHGHLPVLVRWQCKACLGYHYWTGASETPRTPNADIRRVQPDNQQPNP